MEFNFKFDPNAPTPEKPFIATPPTPGYLKTSTIVGLVDSAYSEDGAVLKTLSGITSVTVAHGPNTFKTLTDDSAAKSAADKEKAFFKTFMPKAKASKQPMEE